MNRIYIIVLSIIMGMPSINTSGQAAPSPQATEQSPITDLDSIIFAWSRTFAEILSIAQQKHYKISNLEECMVQSFDAFLNCLDPHSDFLGPKAFTSISDKISGEFPGIGVIIDATRESKDKFLMIVDTIPEGPSDKAGILPMDKIIDIDGKPLEGMSTDEALSYLKGPRGTTVHIKVLRDEQQDLLEFDITRDIIKEQVSLAFYLEKQQIYYVALTMFTGNSARQLEDILTKINDKSVRALILDLRNNSGGLLDSAIDIVGLFVPKGSAVVTTKDKHNKETSRYVTKRDPLSLRIPIFILVNNFTASAAEILAGCLKQHAMHVAENKKKQLTVFIVGTKTFGKGSVQEVIPVGNDSAVKITTSLYFLPDDVSIQGLGIIPDFIIEKTFPPTKQVSWFTKFYGREQSLKNYIKPENKNNEAAPDQQVPQKETKHESWNVRAQKRLQEDNQFKEAVSIINLYHTAFTSCPQNIRDRASAIEFINSIYMLHGNIPMVEVKM